MARTGEFALLAGFYSCQGPRPVIKIESGGCWSGIGFSNRGNRFNNWTRRKGRHFGECLDNRPTRIIDTGRACLPQANAYALQAMLLTIR